MGMRKTNITKGATYMNETLKALKERRSIRAYQKEQITEAQLETILDAGYWAPSAKN